MSILKKLVLLSKQFTTLINSKRSYSLYLQSPYAEKLLRTYLNDYTMKK